jgi:hypothetical protein
MKKTKTLLTGALMAVLLGSIGGCVFHVRGPYSLITVRDPYYRDYRDCRYRNC